MELLPSSFGEFRSKEYWDSFFAQRDGKAFEWYGSLADFRAIWDKEAGASSGAKTRCKVLNVGCGNSSLPVELSRIGYTDVMNVDFSELVIEEMRKAHASKWPKLDWKVVDVRQRNLVSAFEEASFDVVIDKGFADAFLSADTSAGSKEAAAEGLEYFQSVLQLLRPGSGRLLLITLAQDHVTKLLLRFLLGDRSTEVACYPFKAGSSDSPSAQGPAVWLQPVMIAIRRRDASEEIPKIPLCSWHSVGDPSGEAEAVPLGLLPKKVAEAREWWAVNSDIAKYRSGRRSEFTLSSKGTRKFDFVVYDSTGPARSAKTETAAIIVPAQNRLQWIIATAEGNQKLAEQASTRRLILVLLAIGATGEVRAESLEEVKDEVMPYLAKLRVETAKKGGDFPIMAIAQDASQPLGERREVCEMKSSISGTIAVYDISADGDSPADGGKSRSEGDADDDRAFFLRVMVFQSNSFLAQSEILCSAPVGGSTRLSVASLPKVVKYHPLPPRANYYSAILAFFLASPISHPRAAADLLGLGGGVLVQCMDQCLKQAPKGRPPVALTCVELDPCVAQIAQSAFGFREFSELDENGLASCKLHIGDAFAYVKELADASRDVMVVDLSGEASSSDALSCPPRKFVEREFLELVAQKLKSENGTLIMNVVCRAEGTRQQIEGRLCRTFGAVVRFKVPEDVNTIYAAVTGKVTSGSALQDAIVTTTQFDLPKWVATSTADVLQKSSASSS